MRSALLKKISILVFAYSLAAGTAGCARTPQVALPHGHLADLDHLPVVYRSDFGHAVGDAWNVADLANTPNGEPFLGPFANETASMTISRLPPHTRLRVSFDLFIIDSWDGNDQSFNSRRQPMGPDFFILDLAGGPTLIRSTFSVMSDRDHQSPVARTQTYPSPIPSQPNPAGTGAADINSLGFIFRFASNTTLPMDGRYPIVLTLPHSDDRVQLNFSGANLQGTDDESWAVANVKVEALPEEGSKPDDASIAERFAIALRDDPAAAQQAFWSLVADGDATVAYLAGTAGGFGVDRAAILADLGCWHADAGDASAKARLIAAGPAAEPLLQEISLKKPDLAWQCARLYEQIELHPIEAPTARKTALAARLLYVINTRAAKKLAARLTPSPRPTPPPGSADYAADWLTRFDAAYQLGPGQHVRYIPTPLPPERDAFTLELMRRQFHANQTAGDPKPFPRDEAIAITSPDRVTLASEVTRLNSRFGTEKGPLSNKGLTRALYATRTAGSSTSLKYPAVIVDPSMEDLELPGDWVVSQFTPQEQLLGELSGIIKLQTGRSIRFERRSEKRNVIVVTGHYQYRPQFPTDRPKTIQLYSDVKDDPPDENSRASFDLDELFRELAGQFKLAVLDETDSGSQAASWQLHRSYIFLEPEKLDLVLKNLSEQTSLKFTRQTRNWPVIFAVESLTAGARPVAKRP